ncbi:MAG: argininosuccinate lyase [Gemmatimonadota bacterium]|nr:argininosuccinate lyase [Gemmatimonadota bacterium]|tara:strand:- start:3693 stop:5129 length:1437 start_codon:yes stop_codon:yes gene_type:complete
MSDEPKETDPVKSPEAHGSLWGARFDSVMAPEMIELNQSLSVDSCLWREDIRGSKAWAQALGRAGVLTQTELASVINGLQGVALRIETDGLGQAQEEDIHSVVERMLVEEVGSLGGKLHTGRSRNDQSATGVRIFGMRACDQIREEVLNLIRALRDLALRGLHLPMPGYTHLQQAQPIRAAQWALSHVFAFLRDIDRINAARGAAAVLPLGSGAIAGCPFAVDREALKDELGFQRVSPNSVDAVADRDWICDLLYAGAMIGVHMSRLSEDLVLFSSSGFGFVRLSDGFSTGSSLMPQKRNPDVAELARGKSGRLHGNLVTLLTLLKGLPTGYNRDLQEDKEALFDTCNTLGITVPALAGGIKTAEFVAENLESAIDTQLFATDLADYLVKKGVPFRETHGVVGRLVRLAEEEGLPLSELSIDTLQNEHEAFEEDVVGVFDWERSAEVRDTIGGTSLRAVQEQLEEVSAQLSGIDTAAE